MANASSCAKLADISNLQQQPKLQAQDAKTQKSISLRTSKNIDELKKENMTLMKALADRNKIIQLCRIEVQKTTIDMQKMQQQNSQLAGENSQMLAELNSCKDRLKVLQHELGCANCLLKKRKFMEVGEKKNEKAGKSFNADEESKPFRTYKRRQSKNCSLESVIAKPAHAKEKADKKRVSRRRQSAKFQSQEPEETEDLLEMDDTKFPVTSLNDEIMHRSSPTPSCSLVQKEHVEGNSAPRDETQESRRRSVGRPLRQAAEKVQSYKEMSLKVKMRRTE